MSKRVLLVASKTGYQTRMFGEAAKSAGVELVLATDRCHVLEDPWGDHAIPLRFEEPEQAGDTVAGFGPLDGVVAVGDQAAWIASHVAQRLHLPFHDPMGVALSRNKFSSRQRFQEAGLPAPHHRRLQLDTDEEIAALHIAYPCVLKPLGLSASRGVIRANNPAEFSAAFRRIRAILQRPEIARFRDPSDGFLQVEQYIPGREYAVEALLTRGRMQVVAVFDKPDPLEGPFFEETIYVTPSREPQQHVERITETVESAVRALGLTHGPVHAEVRVNEQVIYALEVAARPIGGLCARVPRFQSNLSYEEVILRHALGEALPRLVPRDPASGVMMIPIPREGIYEDVSGVEEALAVSGVDTVEITAKKGQHFEPLPEGHSYLGFLFARGQSPDRVETSLRQAHERLSFDFRAVLPLISSSTSGERSRGAVPSPDQKSSRPSAS